MKITVTAVPAIIVGVETTVDDALLNALSADKERFIANEVYALKSALGADIRAKGFDNVFALDENGAVLHCEVKKE